jgi:GT2 family glycosyltransferase
MEIFEKKDKKSIIGGPEIRWEIGDAEIVPTCNLIIHRDILKKIKFPENYKYAAFEDKLWCSMAKEKGFKLSRISSGALTHYPHKRSKLIKKEFQFGMESVHYQKDYGSKSEYRLWRDFLSRCINILSDFSHLFGVLFGIIKYYIIRWE